MKKLIKQQGLKVKSTWKKLSDKYNLKLKILSMDSIPVFIFKNNHDIKRSFLILEMLKNNILASNIIYISISHTDKILKIYFKQLEKVFKKMSKTPISKMKRDIIKLKKFTNIRRLN